MYNFMECSFFIHLLREVVGVSYLKNRNCRWTRGFLGEKFNFTPFPLAAPTLSYYLIYAPLDLYYVPYITYITLNFCRLKIQGGSGFGESLKVTMWYRRESRYDHPPWIFSILESGITQKEETKNRESCSKVSYISEVFIPEKEKWE